MCPSSSSGAAEPAAPGEQDAGSASHASSPQSSPHHRGNTYLLRDSSFEALYTHETCLGSGAQGRVDRYQIRSNRKTVAIKTGSSPGVSISSVAEVRMLTYLNTLPEHENLTRMLQIWDHGSRYRIVMPCYPGGDLGALHDLARRFGLKMPEAFLFHAYAQLASGVSFLHEHGVAHRDLKPHNVLVEPVGGALFPVLKIADFGCAELRVEDHGADVGTPRWQPPGPVNAGAKADVWAAGACIYFLATGKAPKPDHADARSEDSIHRWYRAAPAQVDRLVHHGAGSEAGSPSLAEARHRTFDSAAPLPSRGYSPLLEYYVGRALDADPAKRVSAHALLANVEADADRQIGFYKAWIRVCDERPMMQFVYPEPPAGWIPGQGIVQ